MKKLPFILAAIATLTSNGAFAQPSKSTGSGSQAGACASYDQFAWGIGLGALVVLGLVVGFAAGAGSQSGSN